MRDGKGGIYGDFLRTIDICLVTLCQGFLFAPIDVLMLSKGDKNRTTFFNTAKIGANNIRSPYFDKDERTL